VLEKLKTSKKAKRLLLDTYETYRALIPPKPTYRQFITDNVIDEEWWHSRLRLLHLLGSNHGPSASYDLVQILDKLEPYVNELVPEMIILNGRQGRHKEALGLLTHGLGALILQSAIASSAALVFSAHLLATFLKTVYRPKKTKQPFLASSCCSFSPLRMLKVGSSVRASYWKDLGLGSIPCMCSACYLMNGQSTYSPPSWSTPYRDW
jgi:hypothetical protein